jgi:hypothetical protein
VTNNIRGSLDNIRVTALLLVLFLSSFALVGFAAQQGAPPDMNVVKSIRAATFSGAAVIEIELQSSKEFPMRDQIVVLRIGNRDFMKSRSPADGSLKTLIFMLTPEDFGQVADGASMSVRYGLEYSDEPAAQGADNSRWQFGQLNKSLLSQ